jgi:tellurite resistance protein TehA-like permease
MLHLFEFSAVIAGFVLTAVVASKAARPSRWLLVIRCIALGATCSLLKGELAQGWTVTILAVLWDSAAAALGCVIAQYAHADRSSAETLDRLLTFLQRRPRCASGAM